MAYRGLCRIPGRTGPFELVYEQGRVVALRPVDSTEECAADLPWVSPGLFDIQVNGMVGVNLSDEDLTRGRVLEIDAALEAHGVTRWCPTVTTQDPRIVERNLEILGRLIEEKTAPNIHGIHLEGHYISSEPGYRGVHMERYIRDPDLSEMQAWYRAARGKICLFSLAPERTGAIPFIGALKTMGMKVGLVHHRADYQTIRSAAAAGADLSSHLLNGCAKMVHRQHNVIWAQLSLDDLWASFIADGYHIPHYTLRALIRAKGIERSILTSDLAHLSGLPDGEYAKNENTVVLKDEGLWVKSEGTDLLSGAVKTLEKDCAYLVSRAGFSIEDSLIMASLNPARYFGIDDRYAMHAGWSGKLVGFTWRNGILHPKML
jgi:N-acetylglucosamine-6-phosphate deacetylase